MSESGRPSMRGLWDGSRPVGTDPGFGPGFIPWGDRAHAPVSYSEPIIPSRHRARKLHPMQWVTYIFVIITCIAVLCSLLNTYIFLNNLQEAIAEFGKSFQDLGVN
jgi:hypothetical protein